MIVPERLVRHRPRRSSPGGLRGRRRRGRRRAVATTPVTPSSTHRSARLLAADPDAIALITFDEVSTIVPCTRRLPRRQAVLRRRKPEDTSATRSRLAPSRAPRAPCPVSTTRLDRTSPTSCDAFWAGEGNARSSRTSATRPSRTTRSCSLALAALAAGSTDGVDIAEKLQEVSGGSGDGEKCTTFAECAAIIIDGGVATTTASPVRSRSTRSATRPRRPSVSTSSVKTTTTSASTKAC